MDTSDMTPEDSKPTELMPEAIDYVLDQMVWQEFDPDTSEDSEQPCESVLGEPILGESALTEDVAALQSAIAAIPYSTPPVDLSRDLKARLFERIEATSPSRSKLFELLQLSMADLRRKAQDLKWDPLPGMANGAMATYQIDQSSNSIAFFVQATSRGRFPKHYHAEGEAILVLEGDCIVDERVYGPGDRMFSPANTSHQPHTHNGCLLFCVSSLDDRML